MNLTDPIFTDADKARAHLEKTRWPHGPVCPHCGVVNEATSIKGRSARAGLYQCNACREQFTITVGTVFERSKVPLNKWLLATYLMSFSKKGISAHQIGRTLGVTYKTAWFMCHRIREAMAENNPAPLGGEGKIVEADETVVGGKERNKRLSKRNPKNIGAVGKQVAFTLVERNGRARSFHVANVTGKTLRPIMVANVDRKSALMTDDAGQYRPIGKEFASHESVNHGIEEYVRGAAHSNTVEGFFSLLKRGIIGTFHHVSEAHLKRYLAEFDFRYSHRVGLGINDTMRTDEALRGIGGKRLMYRRADKACYA
ncbi:IS1595 family transposase [Brevundimonas sp. AJA228-03]|uniref:IS1595 family transposase n=1 Tax=Brevundimonas sp. AJA228-03 TaxID=2752515 RepID=UPI001ADF52B6|nr:IS1595 family transposase [Brevundimonas sp. AJA228-03]QTN20597.1 IS1595 family transposase [Brevundimonas sp. AJA228-03]